MSVLQMRRRSKIIHSAIVLLYVRSGSGLSSHLSWIANVVPLRKGTLWSPAVSNSDGGRAWLVAFFQAICPGYSGSNGYAGCPNAPNGVSANIYAKTYSDFVKWTTYYWKTHGLPLNIKEFTAEVSAPCRVSSCLRLPYSS